MFGWWRKWRKTVARRKAAAERKNRRQRSRRANEWDADARYADPFDGDL
jgi:hypothetical protein